ncbi:MAG: 2-phospho-L-lactate transferase [Rhodobacteraceae bacterium]|nr:MAG: 2-phospho-L-lactate transferase [Paracoccaceae bacterium]
MSRVVALCGGIGGAKLALGLAQVVAPERLTVIVNTGDDFRHLGLHVSPDLDTVTYTLAGRANPETGWGRADETWRFMAALGELGGETWFSLGDTDLATNVHRTVRLAAGDRLTEISRAVAAALGVRVDVIPATDDPLATVVETDDGPLPFQRYFVERRCAPRLTGLRYEGAEAARPTPETVAALTDAALGAVILCPSNPYLSIDPMLAIPGFRDLLAATRAPKVAVSPIVGGAAVKGPLAKIMAEKGVEPSPAAVAAHYGDLLDVFVVDEADADAPVVGARKLVAPTVMRSLADRVALARVVLDAAGLDAAGLDAAGPR